MFKKKNLNTLAMYSFLLLPSITNAGVIETLLKADFTSNCANVAEGDYSTFFKGYHTGNDYECNKPGNVLKTISFGKIAFINDMPITDICNGTTKCTGKPDHGMGNVLEITHLLSTGEEVTSSYNHLSNINSLSTLKKYVTAKQEVAYVGASGQESDHYWKPPHLHFEMKEKPRSFINGPWGYSEKTFSNGKIIFPGIPSDYGFVNPNEYLSQKHVALPILSRTINPDSATNFDVYGIANKPLYGYLKLEGFFQESAILVRDFFTRADASGNTGTLTATTGKFLGGKRINQSVSQISGNYSYAEGDYLFLAYVKDSVTGKLRFGYPVKFSVVKEGDLIVDNDQKNADTDITNDLNTEPTYNGHVGFKMPGYFLTADLQLGRSNKSAQWKPYKEGNYKIYIHIPEYGATATSVRYVIKNDGTNSSSVVSNSIDQSTNADKWVQITAPDGSDTFQFDDNGYIGLSLSSTAGTANYAVDATQKVAFDAVKFEVSNSDNGFLFNGKTIGYQYHYPSITENWGNQGNFLVNSGVEISNVGDTGMATLDISDSNIFIDYLQDNYSWADAIFNGFEIFDVNNTINDFISIKINPATNMVGLDMSRITWDANHIWVNWQGLFFDSNTVVSLDINK